MNNDKNNSNNKLPQQIQPYLITYTQPNSQQIQPHLTPIHSQPLQPLFQYQRLIPVVPFNQFISVQLNNTNNNNNNMDDNMNNNPNNNPHKFQFTMPTQQPSHPLSFPSTTTSPVFFSSSRAFSPDSTLSQNTTNSMNITNPININNNSNNSNMELKLPSLAPPPQQPSQQPSQQQSTQLPIFLSSSSKAFSPDSISSHITTKTVNTVNTMNLMNNNNSNNSNNDHTDNVIKLPSLPSLPPLPPLSPSPSSQQESYPLSTLSQNTNNDNDVDLNTTYQSSSSSKPQKRRKKKNKKNKKNNKNRGLRTDPCPNGNCQIEIGINQIVHFSAVCPLCDETIHEQNTFKQHYKAHYLENTETPLVSTQYWTISTMSILLKDREKAAQTTRKQIEKAWSYWKSNISFDRSQRRIPKAIPM